VETVWQMKSGSFTRNKGRPFGTRDKFDPPEVAAYKAEADRYPGSPALQKKNFGLSSVR
jgi:hypothetical protein